VRSSWSIGTAWRIASGVQYAATASAASDVVAARCTAAADRAGAAEDGKANPATASALAASTIADRHTVRFMSYLPFGVGRSGVTQ
jgi:hypothetical protein